MKSQSLLVLISTAIMMHGCDSGGGFTDGDENSGQAPDPVVVDFPIAFVERPLVRGDDDVLLADNILDPTGFKPGARLILKQRANASAGETAITDGVFPANEDGVALYDVKDLEPSVDGTKLLFAMRAPEIENADEDDQPKWNIWEYDLTTEELRRIIQSDITAQAGHDVSPHYLPDGSIIFSSTRQRRSKAILLDENKPQFAPLTEDLDSENVVLHTMSEEGEDITQISFNASHDLQPSVLDDGRIMFLRWDNFDNLGGVDRVSLYTVNPDGSNPSLLYGYHSQNTGNEQSEGIFNNARQLADGSVLVNLRPREFEQLGGDIVTIDVANFTDVDREVSSDIASASSAQTVQSTLPVNIDGTRSPHGYFSSAYPLGDSTGRFLVSWSPCVVRGFAFNIYVNADLQLIDPQGNFLGRTGNLLAQDAEPVTIEADETIPLPCNELTVDSEEVVIADPLYGLWIYDPIEATQTLVDIPVIDRMATEAIILEPTVTPTPIATRLNGEDRQQLRDQGVGVVHIHSVYDLDGVDTTQNGIAATADPAQTSADARPARFLRIMKSVSIPDDDVYDFDLNSADGTGNFRMKDILGYVPVEPDGSVMFKAPSDVALTFSVLDAQGRRISDRHQNWFSVRAGEVRQCVGCHEGGSEVPHGDFSRSLAPLNSGALADAPFPNTLLLDATDPDNPIPHTPPQVGETMAAYYARVNSSASSVVDGARTPSVNLAFEDEWTDESLGLTKSDAIDISYNDLTTDAPLINTSCINNWNNLCRVVVNYNDHIEPIWTRERIVDVGAGPENFTCTNCHSRTDVDGLQQLPAGNRQLELTTNVSEVEVDYTTSFAELMIASPVLEINDDTGILQVEMVHLQVDGVLQYFAIDDEGNNIQAGLDTEFTLVLDDDGNPTPVIVPSERNFGRLMVPGSALNSNAFFDVFANLSDTVDHRPLLTSAEKKLIYEWLDIGGAYYNNPFDAPMN